MAEIDPQAEADKIAERVELVLGGSVYSGWTEVTVERSLDALSGAFEIAIGDKANAGAPSINVLPGDRCELRVAGETVINGWIDAVQPAISGDDHQIRVSGRDRTADLADCSAIHKPASWRNVRLEQIAAELARPFGIKVTASASTGAPISRFALQQGETVQAAIERLLRFRGLLMQPTPAGDLEIITPSSAAPIGALELGRNILAAEGNHDHRERFSQYRVKGQSAGDDHHHGKPVNQIGAIASDPEVTRYRPLLVIAEEQSNGASASTRARWEAGVRAGKSRSAVITVLGWRVAAGGSLWRPNVRVRVQCAPILIDDEVMLVSAVTFAKGDRGTTAQLTVMPPQAWQQLAEGEPRPKKTKKGKKS